MFRNDQNSQSVSFVMTSQKIYVYRQVSLEQWIETFIKQERIELSPILQLPQLLYEKETVAKNKIHLANDKEIILCFHSKKIVISCVSVLLETKTLLHAFCCINALHLKQGRIKLEPVFPTRLYAGEYDFGNDRILLKLFKNIPIVGTVSKVTLDLSISDLINQIQNCPLCSSSLLFS